jgi:hypothetical protein
VASYILVKVRAQCTVRVTSEEREKKKREKKIMEESDHGFV